MFQHVPHCREFAASTDGLDRLGRIYTLQCLPYDFGSSIAADSMVQLMRSMTEVAPTQTLARLTQQVKASLDETKEYWQAPADQSRLARFVDVQGELTVFFILC